MHDRQPHRGQLQIVRLPASQRPATNKCQNPLAHPVGLLIDQIVEWISESGNVSTPPTLKCGGFWANPPIGELSAQGPAPILLREGLAALPLVFSRLDRAASAESSTTLWVRLRQCRPCLFGPPSRDGGFTVLRGRSLSLNRPNGEMPKSGPTGAGRKAIVHRTIVVFHSVDRNQHTARGLKPLGRKAPNHRH
jgi:hypothetical protein